MNSSSWRDAIRRPHNCTRMSSRSRSILRSLADPAPGDGWEISYPCRIARRARLAGCSTRRNRQHVRPLNLLHRPGLRALRAAGTRMWAPNLTAVRPRIRNIHSGCDSRWSGRFTPRSPLPARMRTSSDRRALTLVPFEQPSPVKPQDRGPDRPGGSTRRPCAGADGRGAVHHLVSNCQSTSYVGVPVALPLD